MTLKQNLYLSLCEQIASLWEQDEQMMDTDSITWQLVRSIDDWLSYYRDDDRVSVPQFARNCDRLRALYIEPIALAGEAR